MTTDYYEAPLRLRYAHVGRHRNLHVTYNGRRTLYAVLLALSFDIGFFLICNVIVSAVAESPHGTIVQFHPAPVNSITSVEAK